MPDGEIGAPVTLASARVCKHLGPPFIAGRLLRVQPGTVLDGITRLNHGDDQPCDLGPTDIVCPGVAWELPIRRHQEFEPVALIRRAVDFASKKA